MNRYFLASRRIDLFCGYCEMPIFLDSGNGQMVPVDAVDQAIRRHEASHDAEELETPRRTPR